MRHRKRRRAELDAELEGVTDPARRADMEKKHAQREKDAEYHARYRKKRRLEKAAANGAAQPESV